MLISCHTIFILFSKLRRLNRFSSCPSGAVRASSFLLFLFLSQQTISGTDNTTASFSLGASLKLPFPPPPPMQVSAPAGSNLLRSALDCGAMELDNTFCLTGQCEACMAEVDGKVVLSCMEPVPADGRCEKNTRRCYCMYETRGPSRLLPARTALLKLVRARMKSPCRGSPHHPAA